MSFHAKVRNAVMDVQAAGLSCDHCSAFKSSIHSTRESVEAAARRQGWKSIYPDRHLCPSCSIAANRQGHG